PQMVEQLEPFWVDFTASGSSEFGDYLVKHGDDVAEALLSVTDARAAASARQAERTSPGQRERGPTAGSMSPVSHAQAAISTRLRRPSFCWMLDRWLLTVLTEMNSPAPISWLVRPVAMAATTSVSRSDSGAAVRAAADDVPPARPAGPD